MDIEAKDLPLGFLLNTVGSRVLEETQNALFGSELTVIELGILWLVALAPNRPQSEYAKFQKRDISTFGRYVDCLEKKKFLVRSPHSTDRRAKVLSLTQSGRNILKQERAKALEIERQLAASTPEIIDQLKEKLVMLLNAID